MKIRPVEAAQIHLDRRGDYDAKQRLSWAMRTHLKTLTFRHHHYHHQLQLHCSTVIFQSLLHDQNDTISTCIINSF